MLYVWCKLRNVSAKLRDFWSVRALLVVVSERRARHVWRIEGDERGNGLAEREHRPSYAIAKLLSREIRQAIAVVNEWRRDQSEHSMIHVASIVILGHQLEKERIVQEVDPCLDHGPL
jgi:hypothetical protein